MAFINVFTFFLRSRLTTQGVETSHQQPFHAYGSVAMQNFQAPGTKNVHDRQDRKHRTPGRVGLTTGNALPTRTLDRYGVSMAGRVSRQGDNEKAPALWNGAEAGRGAHTGREMNSNPNP